MQTIIFDLGGVLIDWNPMRLYRKVFPSEEKAQWFLENICTYEWNLLHDAGQPVEVGMRELAEKHPEWKEEIYAYYNRWEEMLGDAFEDTVSVLRKCVDQQGLQVVALTNWSAETFPIAQKRFSFLDWFEETVVSGAEKTRKPHPDIYHTLFERCGITPSKAVFIDDSLPNIEQAENLGVTGIHFEQGMNLEARLQELGVF